MNDSKTFFTELTSNQEASMSGGKKADKGEKPNKQTTKNVYYIFFFGDIAGAGGGAASGGSIGGNSGSATGGSGNQFKFG